MNVESLAQIIGTHLTARQLLLATAESCTGGGLSYWLTSVPGSSNWFERGFVTYSNAAKMEMLGVDANTLSTHGAVSDQTAHEMALGALAHSKADVSIAITGIAGPDGGTADKPVGTVWIAWATREGLVKTRKDVYRGNRQEIRNSTIEMAMSKLIEILSDQSRG